MDFLSNRCIGDKSLFCNNKHYFKKNEDGVVVLNASNFFNVVRHHQELVRVRCNWVCPKEVTCNLHVQLEKLNYYAEFVREKNLNETEIISKIGFLYDKEKAKEKKVFWWTEIVEWEKKQCPKEVTLKWRSQFL